MGAHIFCTMTVRVPSHAHGAPAVRELFAHPWSEHHELRTLSDSSLVSTWSSLFDGGHEGVEGLFDLDGLTAVGCDWRVADEGAVGDCDPVVVACVGGLRFETPGPAGRVVVELGSAGGAGHSAEELLCALRLRMAEAALLAQAFADRDGTVGIHDDHLRYVQAACGEPPDAGSLVAEPGLAPFAVLNPRCGSPALAAAVVHLDARGRRLVAAHPSLEGVAVEALFVHSDSSARRRSLTSAVLTNPHLEAGTLGVLASLVGGAGGEVEALGDVWRMLAEHPAATHEALWPLPATLVASRRPELLCAPETTGEERLLVELLADGFVGTLGELCELAELAEAQGVRGTPGPSSRR